MVSAMSLTLLWDFAPVMLLLIFHYRNYREQALLQKEQAVRGGDPTEDATTSVSGSFYDKNFRGTTP